MNGQNLEIILLPALKDNYIFVLRDHQSNTTAVVDPGDAAPVITFLNSKKWTLDHIFLTHHHWDHINGVGELQKQFPCQLTGPSYDSHRIQNLDRMVSEGDTVKFGHTKFEVWHLPGHTLGHIAYVSKESQLVFSGDVFFGMGCGRLFEGTPEQMYQALGRLKDLPDDTKIYSAHEYTLKNAGYALQVFPENLAILSRKQNLDFKKSQAYPTVPLDLGIEKKTNPFLLAKDLQDFTRLRNLRDNYD